MSKNFKLYAASLSLALTVGASAFAQDSTTTQTGTTQTGAMQTANMQTNTQSKSIASGQKAKIKGVIVDRQADMFTVSDDTGGNVQVQLTGNTTIKSKKFFGSGKTYVADLLTRGLYLEVQGRGGNQGMLVAEKVRFGEDDLRNARALDTRVAPVEGRVTAAEENAQRLSGQLDELTAISNAARGGAKAAQDSADAAIAGVNATNTRITELDDFSVSNTATVNFKVGKFDLSPEAKTSLDTLAQNVASMKGYVVEVTGYSDSTGNTEKNRILSEKRAETVRRYLVENHGIPLRRILQSYGFGEAETAAVADNTTREGRAQNRRVEVKLLISKGLSNQVQVQSPATSNQEQ